MNIEKVSDLNMLVKIPEHLKTDTEKIVWLGNEIRSCLLVMEEAKASISSYEERVRAISKKKANIS